VIPLKDRNPTRNFPLVTILLIAVNVLVFVTVQKTNSDVAGSNRFTLEHAAIPCELTTGSPLSVEELVNDTCRSNDVSEFSMQSQGREVRYTNQEAYPDKRIYLAVVLSMFLHGGWLHLGGNMLFLWIFGNNVEDLLGPVRYVAFYMAGGLVAALAHIAVDPGSTVPVIGASGAIAAVMGAYLLWFPRARILTLIFVVFFGFFTEIRARWVLLGWFVLQFFTSPNSGVAWVAHVGGFLFGGVIAALLARTPWYTHRRLLLDAPRQV
jgi:membrane associated rhomboid family serine protease